MEQQLQHQFDGSLDRLTAATAAGLSVSAQTLVSHLELVLREGVGDLTADQRRFLERPLEQARRVLTVAQNLRTVTLAHAGALDLEWHRCDLTTVTFSAVQKVRPVASSRRRHLYFEASEPVWVSGDPGQLERAVLALLELAIESAPVGSELEIRVREDGVTICCDGEPPALESQLGLALAESLAKLHDGRVEVQRKSGVMTLRLVLRSEAARSDQVVRRLPEVA